MLYFKKERVSHPIKINGQAIPWETAGRDTGVRQFDETNDKEIVAVLNGFADRRKMGVVRISPQIYDSLKKKPTKTIPAQLPPGFGPDGPVRAVDRESVLIKPRERVQPPRPAAPAVVEVSPPPPQQSFRAPAAATPATPAAPATPAIPPGGGITFPKAATAQSSPIPAKAQAAQTEQAAKDAPPTPPKPIKRSKAKKSDVESAVASLQSGE